MTEPIALGPEEQEDLIREIGGILLGAAPESWQELCFIFRSTVGIDSSRFVVITPEGQSRRVTSPSAAIDKMAELRAGMYQEGKGSWFTAKYVIKPPGRYSVEYDYDTEPDFFPPLTAGMYALDFEHFPRTRENTPQWLKQKLEEAAAETKDKPEN